MGEQRRFYRSDEEWTAIAERLKQTPCPHCKAVGTLIRHGGLYGFDESNPGAKRSAPGGSFAATAMHARLRPHVQRLARRQNPTAQPDHRRSVAVPPRRRRRQHSRGHPRHRRLAQRADLATHLETVRSGTKQNPHGPVWRCPPPELPAEPHSDRPRKSSPISGPPSPTPTVPSPPSNMRYGPSSSKTLSDTFRLHRCRTYETDFPLPDLMACARSRRLR